MGFKCGIVGLPNVGKSTLFNALTQTAAAEAANYPFCTIEPNVGEVGVPDERLDTLAAHRQVGQDHPDAADVRRHRRPGARRVEGRRPRQPVPGAHPRGRRGRLRAALLRGRRHHPRRGPHRSGGRRRDGRDRADARRPREPGEARVARSRRRPSSGDKEAKAQLGVVEKALPLLREGKPARMAQSDRRGGADRPRAAAADLEARALRLQRRRGLGGDRQHVHRKPSRRAPRPKAPAASSSRPRSRPSSPASKPRSARPSSPSSASRSPASTA